MTVSPTYPGVYIEEIPSGVHTITGVSTSITAFIGYTAQGDVDTPVHIFSFADFQRAFGGLSVDSPLSYCVRDFFQNGGGEAYVVRVAAGAAAAAVSLKSAVSGGVNVLDVTASSAGTWGNMLQIDIDYDTIDPVNLFNFRATSYGVQAGQTVVLASEVFRNLSMNAFDPSYAPARINSGSQLVSVAVPGGLVITGNGKSISGGFAAAGPPFNVITGTNCRVAFTLNGAGPFEVVLDTTTSTSSLSSVAADLAAKISTLRGVSVTATVNGAAPFTITVQSPDSTQRSAIHFLNAGSNSATATLKLGAMNGGTETEAQAAFRPAMTGTVGGVPSLPATVNTAAGKLVLDVFVGSGATTTKTIHLDLGVNLNAVPNIGAIVPNFRTALANAGDPLLAGATVVALNGSLRILPGDADPNRSFEFSQEGSDTTATLLKLTTGTEARNVARYAPGSGATFAAQTGASLGSNGTAPTNLNFLGNEANKTGIYALANVDLFNLMVIPEATAGSGMQDVLMAAIAYCTRRRAFMIIDTPETVRTFAQAQTWLGTSDASALRSRNSALYFPRLTEPDPLMGGVVGTFASAGALAGLYARTDSERGVWKAPAGTAATIVGATGLSYTLTDGENGTLNPLGLNCLRTFPVYGTISWGARTGAGADRAADEYKYIPVRRLALFLEESLYRGTQWAVFEPNDEPLWASIRLNLGAFMHLLFAQGAFQGRTPRDAYFVKCDKDTTTQNDIDLGRVNILVGFAPLKPAEFVIIQIQQMAGQIVT